MFSIIVPLPENLVTAIEPYRQRFDPLAREISPHIGVISPFHFPSDPLQTLYDHLKTVGEVHAPVRVSLASWDVSDQPDYQIRLPVVAGRRALIALRTDLMTGPLSDLAEQRQDYVPHVILGRFSTFSELQQARKALREFELQFTFTINHLVLLFRDQSAQPWQVQKNIRLEATALSSPRRNKQARMKHEVK